MKSKLTLSSFDAVPDYMKQLGAIAKSMGLTRSALLRLLIAKYVRRAARQDAKQVEESRGHLSGGNSNGRHHQTLAPRP